MDINTEHIFFGGYVGSIVAIIKKNNQYYVIYYIEGEILRIYRFDSLDEINNFDEKQKEAVFDKTYPSEDIENETRSLINHIYEGKL